jgi:predicted restriction endonuclease
MGINSTIRNMGNKMSNRKNWTREQLLVAFNLYCQLPFGKLHSRNLEIIKYAGLIDRSPSALAMKLSNIASLDPEITSTGRKGLKGASLTDKKMWIEMQNNWEQFALESVQALQSVALENETKIGMDDEQLADGSIDYTGSDKSIQIKARIGQGFFRKAVLSAYNYKCCITGLSLPKLLVASHIIPWSKDETNRLNPRNGLSLSMLHDKAFDVGLITINEDMTIKVSKKEMIESDAFFVEAILSYHGKKISLPEKFHPHADFLDYHRKHIFESGVI